MRQSFRHVKRVKPEASRRESREYYLVGLGFHRKKKSEV